jgi:hypothetical protein
MESETEQYAVIEAFIEKVKELFPWTGLADLDGAQLERCKDEAIAELQEQARG